jgi:hypothetical protein
MLQNCNGEVADYWHMMLDHIDEQASQIATLKVICTKERFWQIWKAGECQTVERATQKAKDQLAKEYPEINWDE